MRIFGYFYFRLLNNIKGRRIRSTDKLPTDVDEFLAIHGSNRCVWAFSREAIAIILKRIEAHREANPTANYEWSDFFTQSKELWSEGVVVMPREQLKLSDSDISNLDQIKHLKSRRMRCSELIYDTAVAIAKRNGFIELSNARFLV